MMSLSRAIASPIVSAVALVAAMSLSGIGVRAAEDSIFAPGEPVVTGFPGVVEPTAPPAGSDALDYTLIDPDGASMIIQQLQSDDGPSGQLIDAPSVFSATAAEVGLVFGVALDNAPQLTGATAPNIYLAASSAFGLNIVAPDGDGNPKRVKVGGPGATFMAGQWGSADGAAGYPGSIWKIDGETGEVTLFSTIAANTGAGLGDIVYDPSTAQFFVSDLDTGLIYRLSSDGVILDTFDHGVTGRPAHDLDPVEDDGSAMAVTDPAFDSQDPATWGFTQSERKVYGLALYGGRLYYAVADGPQIWSVRIQADGSFGAARWELDVAGLPSTNEITHIAFDPQGRMILAQRGALTASYDYTQFAEPLGSSVVRYQREFPDDPATSGRWQESPDTYAIGMSFDGANASGGVALGPKYNHDSGAFDGACDAYIWASGDALRDNPDLDPALDPPAQVAGLQGNRTSLVNTGDERPLDAFYTDYDGETGDDEADKAGHVGGVAIWQDCAGDAETYVEPPFLAPPDFTIGGEEEDEGESNLTLEKWSSPYLCFDGGANWHCNFTIRVENTGDEPYWGPVAIHDYLPDHNAGAVMDFWPQPPWSCSPSGATAWDCVTGPVLLYPGDGLVLHEVVTLPKAMVGYCDLPNVAGLTWFWGHDDDPGDDFNAGVAGINAPGCLPPGGGSDLSLTKVTFPSTCFDAGVDWLCSYVVAVQNAGPGNYSGPIQVTDTLSVNATATTFGPWSCLQAGPILTCDIIAPPVNAPPGWTSGFLVSAHVPKNVGDPLCDLDNKANIAAPAAGSPSNLLPGNDFDEATTHIPDPACLVPQPQTDLEIQKGALGCVPFVMGVNGYLCEWQLRITNLGPDPYTGPLKFVDTSALATYNELQAIAPATCTGPSDVTTCDIVGPVLLNPGVPAIIPFHTFYPDGPDACSATNNASIQTPSPGSAQNPAGNDASVIGQMLPNPLCAVPGLPKLNIQKTATGCADDPASTDWLCEFDIQVLNYGAGPQAGPIEVKDFNDKPTTFAGAACAPSGVGAYLCSLPGPLNPGDDWSFHATTRVNPNSVTLADCNVVNTVYIWTPWSLDPGHFSQASQKVPQLFINVGPGPVAVYCDPPSLALSKTAEKTVKAGDGYDITFRIRADSTGPDPYHGTVELDEILPDGAVYVASSWPCVPTTGNDMHCSSPYKDIPVGKYTTMTITIHVSKDVAIKSQCHVVNTVNAAISAEVLHSDEGAQYTASAEAELPASLCRAPQQCPVERVMPGGECCDEGLVWNGKQCAAPRPICPDDSHLSGGKCVCDKGTEGKPGKCEPIQSTPVCPDDSHLSGGKCVCDKGTEGKPGRCTPIDVTPICPDDSHLSGGKCVCDKGTEGKPGECRPIVVEPVCPRDSRLVDGECVCKRGTHGDPGECRPDVTEPICPDDSHLSDGDCVCDRGTEGRPGRCTPIEVTPICPKDSRLLGGKCVCRRGTEGSPGNCRPIEEEEPQQTACPADSHFDTRRNSCVCNRPLTGKPGNCEAPQDTPQLELDNNNLTLRRLPTIK